MKKAKPALRANCPTWPNCSCIVRGQRGVDCGTYARYGLRRVEIREVQKKRKR